MMFAAAFIATLLFVGFLVMAKEMRDAPEGIQTERGFQLTWRNQRLDVSDISCVWSHQSGHSAVRRSTTCHSATA